MEKWIILNLPFLQHFMKTRLLIHLWYVFSFFLFFTKLLVLFPIIDAVVWALSHSEPFKVMMQLRCLISVPQDAYPSSYMTGILQNFLDDFATKYFLTAVKNLFRRACNFLARPLQLNWIYILILQIFEWLAGMPVELEGYIRPGCTILTVFIAMPQFMWEKVHQICLYLLGSWNYYFTVWHC